MTGVERIGALFIWQRRARRRDSPRSEQVAVAEATTTGAAGLQRRHLREPLATLTLAVPLLGDAVRRGHACCAAYAPRT